MSYSTLHDTDNGPPAEYRLHTDQSHGTLFPLHLTELLTFDEKKQKLTGINAIGKCLVNLCHENRGTDQICCNKTGDGAAW